MPIGGIQVWNMSVSKLCLSGLEAPVQGDFKTMRLKRSSAAAAGKVNILLPAAWVYVAVKFRVTMVQPLSPCAGAGECRFRNHSEDVLAKLLLGKLVLRFVSPDSIELGAPSLNSVA